MVYEIKMSITQNMIYKMIGDHILHNLLLLKSNNYRKLNKYFAYQCIFANFCHFRQKFGNLKHCRRQTAMLHIADLPFCRRQRPVQLCLHNFQQKIPTHIILPEYDTFAPYIVMRDRLRKLDLLRMAMRCLNYFGVKYFRDGSRTNQGLIYQSSTAAL